MIKRKKLLISIIIAGICSSIFTNVKVFASDKSNNGLNIENGVLKSVDEDISGEVDIPSDVTVISEQLFFNNDKITKVVIPGSVKKINNMAFNGCENLKEVIIEEGVESIGGDCFTGCDNLEKVSIPSTVKKIDTNSFGLCGKLSDVNFKADSLQIGRWAFTNTPWLEKQRNDDGLAIIGNVLLDGSKASGSIEIPAKVTIIEDGAFERNNNIEKIILSNKLKEIGQYAFYGCENLSSIQLPESLKSIGSSAFDGCKKISDIYIPYSVSQIGTNVFDENTNLTGNTEVYYKVQEQVKHELQYSIPSLTMFRAQSGWNSYNGNRFYKKTDGSIQTGWMELNGRTYYFYSNGIQATGFINLNGTYYYLDPQGSGDDFGSLKTGWQSINGNWYYFSPQSEGDKVKGFMKTSWFYNNGNWYYFYSDGTMATGFIDLNEAYYYLDESNTSNIGIMKSGWQKINEYWYYFNTINDDGVAGMMRKGWQKINGVWYYFNYSDGKMASNTWVDGYYVNGSGALE
ncbi:MULTISPECIES: leucine-rich repeat protein [Clostridium]|uniref:Toxin A n=1 Tax=Clostridium butyricum TaxID=1492 RepID=A0A6N3GBJ5_CLOBU|nr:MULTISPECIES: leucine-rich repeat protein [Clostridium]ETI89477.1 MAG: Surface protein PspC [Clostridium butyricum DORA_1]AXB85692.1 PspC family transcriptional regulator [Clostridium butyricum]ENZ33606.1 hypothetical protein HMPREF1084_02076 [Clostridium butyricum 60E.3]MBO1685048.1 leucine-rich repeat protein [Clostridium butyricum]MDI9207870.1 leucine-rich repeat protein [Clostridium butyricum]